MNPSMGDRFKYTSTPLIVELLSLVESYRYFPTKVVRDGAYWQITKGTKTDQSVKNIDWKKLIGQECE